MATSTIEEHMAGTQSEIGKMSDRLAQALLQEARLLDDLRAALMEQRAGVAQNDVRVIEESINQMSRTLLTIEEARRHRTTLIAHLSGERVLTLSEVESALPPPMRVRVVDARAAARRAATAVAREVAINDHIVRRALDAGEAYIQLLFSTVSGPDPSYMPTKGAGEKASAGMLLNRRA